METIYRPNLSSPIKIVESIIFNISLLSFLFFLSLLSFNFFSISSSPSSRYRFEFFLSLFSFFLFFLFFSLSLDFWHFSSWRYVCSRWIKREKRKNGYISHRQTLWNQKSSKGIKGHSFDTCVLFSHSIHVSVPFISNWMAVDSILSSIHSISIHMHYDIDIEKIEHRVFYCIAFDTFSFTSFMNSLLFFFFLSFSFFQSFDSLLSLWQRERERAERAERKKKRERTKERISIPFSFHTF